MGNFPLCISNDLCPCNNNEKKMVIENNEINDFYETENEKPTDTYGKKISISKESKYFFHTQVTKIQRAFRKYLQRKTIKKFSSTIKHSPPNENKKINESLLPLNTLNSNIQKKNSNNLNIKNNKSMYLNFQNVNSMYANISPNFKSIKNNKIVLADDIISKRRNSCQDSSTIKKQQSKILSFFSMSSEEEMNVKENNINIENLFKNKEEEIYGFFLKKSNKSLKYHGEKDKFSHKKNGYGIVTWDDKSKLNGIFKDNKVSGFCKFINKKNKTIYKGEYIKNIPKGYGRYETLHYIREGFWEKNNLNGIGYEIWDDKTFYKGEFLNNKKHGIGIYQWPDKTYYEGEWKNNKMNGYGIIYYTNESFYCGEVLNGNMHGFGLFSWKNKHKYIGYFKNDLKNGFGVFIWQMKPLECFVGFWNNGKQNGVGAKVHNGVFTYGIWENGKKDNWLKGEWEVKRCLTPEEMKFEKFLYKNELNALLKKLNL